MSHEALIREWKRLAEWLYEARDDIPFQQSLSKDVVEWEQRQCPRERLYRGAQLKEAQAWARRYIVSERELAFLHASENQQQHSNRLKVLLLLILLIPIGLGVSQLIVLAQQHGVLPITITSANDDDGVGSLGAAIRDAGPNNTIHFSDSLKGKTIILTKDLTINKSLTLIGSGVTISSGQHDYQIFINSGISVSIKGLAFKDGVFRGSSFILNYGNLVLDTILISDYDVQGPNTGLIYNHDGQITITNSTITNNVGEIYSTKGQITITNTTISNMNRNNPHKTIANTNPPIYNDTNSILIIRNSTIADNLSYNNGGGIYNAGQLTISDTTISGNMASGSNGYGGYGGGIDNEGTLTVTNSTFSGNMASGSNSDGLGGGITNLSTGTLMVSNSTFSGNMASGSNGQSHGGGIENVGKLTVTNSTFFKNIASGSNGDGLGGGIYNYMGSSATIRFCTIYGNTSGAGGGIRVDPTGSSHLTISSSIIAANSAHDGPNISGPLISDGYNLSENFAGATGLNPTDKQVTLADFNIDTTLGNNGGPTQTLMLLQGSKAIDAIPQQACSSIITDLSGHTVTINTDQRGMPRPDDNESNCDVGAYESSG